MSGAGVVIRVLVAEARLSPAGYAAAAFR
jgi:hypothetical protein